MKLLLAYSLRNLLARRLTTALTAGGMALVVFAFTAILMLAEGLQRTLVDSGSPDNVVVIRKSADLRSPEHRRRGARPGSSRPSPRSRPAPTAARSRRARWWC